jgi:hypothetical protein
VRDQNLVDEFGTPLLMPDQSADSSPVSALPLGIAGAKFGSRLASPGSRRERPPPVPSWDPGGPNGTWVVAARRVSFKSPHTRTR